VRQLSGKRGGIGALRRKTMPGLVQNWPAPNVKEVCSPMAMLSARSRKAPGRTNRGFVLLISAKTGMGQGVPLRGPSRLFRQHAIQ